MSAPAGEMPLPDGRRAQGGSPGLRFHRACACHHPCVARRTKCDVSGTPLGASSAHARDFAHGRDDPPLPCPSMLGKTSLHDAAPRLRGYVRKRGCIGNNPSGRPGAPTDVVPTRILTALASPLQSDSRCSTGSPIDAQTSTQSGRDRRSSAGELPLRVDLEHGIASGRILLRLTE
jgi:hypothetical protein